MIPRKKRLERYTQLRAKSRDSLKRRTRMRQVRLNPRRRRRTAVKEQNAVRVYPDGREVCCENSAGRREYYRRRDAMYERQNGICVICGKWIPPGEETFEHQDGRNPRFKDERIEKDGQPYNGVAHGVCNTEKGSRRIPYLYQVQHERVYEVGA